MTYKPETPFDNIGGALEYVSLLCEARDDAKAAVEEDLAEAIAIDAARRVEALKIVIYKLDRLEDHLTASRRLLNDLRTLRRLLLQGQEEEGDEQEVEAPPRD